jgi:Ca2+-binding RTX toxin-like protein
LGGDGNDILSGGAGADILQGGAGDDMFLLGSVADFAAGELLEGGAGNFDLLRYTGTVGTLILTDLVQGIEYVEITNAAGSALGTGAVSINATNLSEPIGLIGNNGANVLTGTVFDDTLYGNGGNDTLNGGSGNDTLNGGLGNDTFRFALDDGQDLVQDSSGTADRVLFQSGINPLDLIISQQANDLRIAIEGTTDQITVQNWYTSTANRTERIQAGNGEVLLSSQVDQLIQAMAQFTANTGLSWDAAAGGAGDPTQQAQFQAIIAAAWQ